MLKVFIADDSQLIRDRLKEVITEHGLQVVGESGNAEEAIQAIRRLAPDIVTLDVRMPSGGGLAVLNNIKAKSPSPLVLVLTSYPYPEYRHSYLMAGADYFFDKTRDIQVMNNLLDQLVQKHNGCTGASHRDESKGVLA